MNEIILPHNDINRDTSALLPAYHTDYQTIIWEQNHRFYVKKTPLQLIKEACLEGGADLDGRRAAVTIKRGSQQKLRSL
ncbi:competence protein ComK [Alkalihalobacillus sp. BA299]|uniref:competence protein ComK n=1 Tax=Alkalihalobacillus sp. BA299 TaxID=2815938 RepID=UPI001AD9B1B0|nr:competence protein ComK [Alkalihalobacillus sp. BA299]